MVLVRKRDGDFGSSGDSHVRPAVVCVGVRCGNEVGTLMTAGIAM